MRKGFLAPDGLEKVLERELGSRVHERFGRLFLVDGDAECVWAQNTWYDVREIRIRSISDAAKQLRNLQRNWWLHSVSSHRRARLIQEQLPLLKRKPIVFPTPVPKAPLGSWTLVDDQRLLYACRCSSAYPDGELHFAENKLDPPSRAYLKLWEFFTLRGIQPTPGERVLDLGASPGGWTWVLDQLGVNVVAVDKAPLSPNLKLSHRVEVLEKSAFALSPQDVGRVDWLFSDIICYPDRLFELVGRWLEHVPNLVCTVKFQGDEHYEWIKAFAGIPGARLEHLSVNKHELTWSRLRPRS